MSDPDNAPDPVDQAYAEAEALLRDDADRAARRARVLGAVARAAEPAPAAPALAPPPPPRRAGWRPAPWLAAASIVGVTALIALRVTPPAVVRPPPIPETSEVPRAPPQNAAESPPQTAPPVAVSPAPPRAEQPRARVMRPSTLPPAAEDAPPPLPIPPVERRVETPAPPPPLPIPPVQRRVETPAPAPRAAMDTAPPPPPPPPIPPIPPVQRRVETPAPAVMSPAPMPESVVVTGSALRARAEAFPAESAPARLRAAAAAGRLAEVQALLDQGAAVDAPDAEGETALMKAVRAGQPAAAALLRRHGASLDRRNRAGLSARDVAAQRADPALDRALGLAP